MAASARGIEQRITAVVGGKLLPDAAQLCGIGGELEGQGLVVLDQCGDQLWQADRMQQARCDA